KVNRRSDRVIQVDKVNAYVERGLDGFAQRFYAIALGSVVACSNKRGAGFIGHVEILLRRFAGDVGVDAFVDGRLHHSLRAAGTPRNTLHVLLRIANSQRLTS